MHPLIRVSSAGRCGEAVRRLPGYEPRNMPCELGGLILLGEMLAGDDNRFHPRHLASLASVGRQRQRGVVAGPYDLNRKLVAGHNRAVQRLLGVGPLGCSHGPQEPPTAVLAPHQRQKSVELLVPRERLW